MTQRGELLTPKGEIYESVFHSRKQRVLSYQVYSGKAKDFSFEYEADNNVSYKMLFVLKGDLSLNQPGKKKPYITLNNQQHNLITVSKKGSLKASSIEENIELIIINLSASFLNSYLPAQHPSSINLLNANNTSSKIFSKHNLFITPEIGAILNGIENSAHTGFCMELFLESKVIELLLLQFVQVELFSTEELPGKLKKEEIDKMNEVREILISDSNGQHSLRTLAHMVGTNEFNLKKEL